MPPHLHRVPGPRAFVRLLLVPVMLMFVALAWLTPHEMLRDGTWWRDAGVDYRSATLAFNYLDLGIVRRGLGGTLLRLTGLAPNVGLAVFHLVSAVIASAALCALIWRPFVGPTMRVLSVVGVAALFLFWGADPGRTDVVLAGLLGIATFHARRRPLLSAACLTIAVGFHENGLIFGWPLVFALWCDDRWRAPGGGAAVVERPASQRATLAAALMLAGVTVLQLSIGRMPHADVGATADWFWSHLPHSEAAEWALYFFVAGGRGIEVAVCQNLRLDPNYWLHVASGLAVIGGTILVFSGHARRSWAAPLIASTLPFLFLSALSIDLARWSTFAALNAWFVCVSRPEASAQTFRERGLAWRVALLALLIFAVSPRQVMPRGLDIFSPAPLVDRIVRQLTGRPPSPSIAIGLRTCDPTWRDLLVPRKAGPAS